ncbi:tetraacyldisaccharide 4'-kinase [Celerinatantimonas sp. YJH-8]|uniref:tetraacyldisaccharide 4'-kinase n=1 Tax=Celerinatantimonas sp. YJH-8 TaxID=3228714 RepID=UPI0038C56781
MMMLDHLWYQRSLWRWFLWPLSCLFKAIASRRHRRFLSGEASSYRPPVPVIIVGNISVGGNGKTPVVLALCEYLSARDYHPAVISRGYGGSSKQPLWVEAEMDASLSGDEPLLIRRRSQCPVVVGANRQASVELILQRYPECNVIISDDGMQHYRLARDIELCVVDAVRRFGNEMCLPAGPLREPVSRLHYVDRIIANGSELPELACDVMTLRAQNWRRVSDDDIIPNIPTTGYALAGIGNPQRFYQTLSQQGLKLDGYIEIGDHRRLSAAQIKQYQQQVVFMTEKDALKYRKLAGPNWYYLPVTASLPEEFYMFIQEKLEQLYAVGS